MRIDFVTIFPRMFDAFLAEGVIARGIKSGALDIRVWDLREYASDKHRSTDDEAYGGGPGMVMLAEPVLQCVDAIENVKRQTSNVKTDTLAFDVRRLTFHVVMTSPQGRRFDQ